MTAMPAPRTLATATHVKTHPSRTAAFQTSNATMEMPALRTAAAAIPVSTTPSRIAACPRLTATTATLAPTMFAH